MDSGNLFYFMAKIAMAEVPAAIPATDAGKIFAAIMAFVAIGAAISAIRSHSVRSLALQ